MEIQGSVSCVVEPIVNSLKFPDLTVKEFEESFDVNDIFYSLGSAASFCCVEGKEKEERKVVRIRLSLNRNAEDYHFIQEVCALPHIQEEYSEIKNEKVMVVTGVGRVVEAFYQLLALLE